MKLVKVRFSSECFIEAESIKEAKEKWEGLSLYSVNEGCKCEFIDVECVEDGETYEDVTDLFNKA